MTKVALFREHILTYLRCHTHLVCYYPKTFILIASPSISLEDIDKRPDMTVK